MPPEAAAPAVSEDEGQATIVTEPPSAYAEASPEAEAPGPGRGGRW
jgi:hypothetical protein